ncbi:MAG: 30S ribosomal protein S9 [Proteobacteria bacterium]|nr:30S ribosomal protein S9 [Pseudomonadota bacterium]
MTIKKNLTDLKSATTEKATASPVAVVTQEDDKPRIDGKGRAYGTGRRKDAVARVWISRGSGKIIVNDHDVVAYFARGTQRLVINQPFELSSRVGQFDVMCLVSGGGLSGQAGAVRHGISRALVHFEPALRPTLKKAGMLVRDSRVVERKKYGRHKARKGTQWVKR